jgi:hypothetical protein
MKNLVKTALVALALTGAAMTTTAAPANAAVAFAIGPDGAHVGFSSGYWYDRDHHRHFYRYPREWRRYGHPLGWYRSHPNWHRSDGWWR